MQKFLIIGLGSLLVVCLGLAGWLVVNRPAHVGHQHTDSHSHTVATATPIGGPFELVNHNGETVTQEDFPGMKMMFFGFTNCTGICQAEIDKMADVLGMLGDEGRDIKPLFITIDPARDTPEVLKEFVELYDTRITGLTGTIEQIEQIESDYKVYASRVDMSEHMTIQDGKEAYLMDHSSFTYLMDENDQLLMLFDRVDTAEQIVEEIRTAL